MSTPAPRLVIPSLVVAVAVTVSALSACSGDDDGPAVDSAATTTVALTLPPTPDTADLPVSTPPPPDTADLPTSTVAPTTVETSSTPAPVAISVTVGVDSGPDRVDTVPAGTLVTLTVVNPTGADEFHLHGFDLGDGQELPAGQPATFTFTADTTGRFELESHETGDVIMILEVV
jgi:hypothetical protein